MNALATFIRFIVALGMFFAALTSLALLGLLLAAPAALVVAFIYWWMA